MTLQAKVSLMMAIAGAAALCAGCGSSPSRVPAHAAGGPAAQAFAYSRCMRQHGVADFPDPHVTTTPGGGSVKIAMMAPASVGKSAPRDPVVSLRSRVPARHQSQRARH